MAKLFIKIGFIQAFLAVSPLPALGADEFNELSQNEQAENVRPSDLLGLGWVDFTPPELSENEAKVFPSELHIQNKLEEIHIIVNEIYSPSEQDLQLLAFQEQAEIADQLNSCYEVSALGESCSDLLRQGLQDWGLSLFQMRQAISYSVWGDDSLWDQFPENKARYNYLLSDLSALYNEQEPAPRHSAGIQKRMLELLIYQIRSLCFLPAFTRNNGQRIVHKIFSCGDLITSAQEEGISYLEARAAVALVETSLTAQYLAYQAEQTRLRAEEAARQARLRAEEAERQRQEVVRQRRLEVAEEARQARLRAEEAARQSRRNRGKP